MFETVGLSLLTLALSYLGTSGVRRWAERHHLLDIPNERSSHTRPVPRGGGLAIVTLTLLGCIGFWLFHPVWPWETLVAYAGGATLISGVSWLDDKYSLPNRVRFAAHSLGALLLILGCGYWQVIHLPWVGPFSSGWLGLPVTFLWIVGLTNAYNFMDGIDGIAGGQAVVAGVGWLLLGWLTALPLVGVLGMLLACSTVGFLGHNWPPARIFMGDVGSAFLGYTFAALAVMAAQSHPRCAVAGILLVGPFVFDTLFTFFRRLRAGENVFTAHRSHLYQRLIIVGYSHRSVTLLYISLAGVFAALALLWCASFPWVDPLLVVSVPAVCVALWCFVVRQERRQVLCR